MAEGLRFEEVAAEEAAEHRHGHGDNSGPGRILSIAEALLLSIVTITVAWSGFAAAKWDTAAQDLLAESSLASIAATQTDNDAQQLRNLDATAFDAWFTAYVADRPAMMKLAEARFRPEFRRMFDEWLATDPMHADSPIGHPMMMTKYELAEERLAEKAAERAQELHRRGVAAGQVADDYVRTTVVLAGVLFLIGISRTFSMVSLRTILLAVGGTLLLAAIFLNLQQPGIPA